MNGTPPPTIQCYICYECFYGVIFFCERDYATSRNALFFLSIRTLSFKAEESINMQFDCTLKIKTSKQEAHILFP